MQKLSNICREYPNMTRLLESRMYARRKVMKISQGVLAERTGLTRNCIQQMECHEHLPRLNTLFELMKELGFDESESKEFMAELQKAYYMDTDLQESREKQLAGVI